MNARQCFARALPLKSGHSATIPPLEERKVLYWEAFWSPIWSFLVCRPAGARVRF